MKDHLVIAAAVVLLLTRIPVATSVVLVPLQHQPAMIVAAR